MDSLSPRRRVCGVASLEPHLTPWVLVTFAPQTVPLILKEIVGSFLES
jgi:hypothetical protein